MPRVHKRKARKDYPASGIKKGDEYYTARVKTGPRSGFTIRQLRPIRASQLTTSEFYSGWYGEQETLEDNPEFDHDTVSEVANTIRELGETARESYDNMPESLQYGATGELLETRADHCEITADALDEFADQLENALEADRQAIRDEVQDLLGDMPE